MVAQATQIHTTAHIPSATSAKVEHATQTKQVHLEHSDRDAKEHESKMLSENQLKDLTEQLNTQVQNENIDISFGYDKELNKVYISVVDKNSGKEIRKLPSDEALKFAKSMKESLGRLLDRRG